MFQAEYSSGQPLRMLVDLRAAIDDALAGGLSQTSSRTSPSSKKSAPAVTSAKPAASAMVAAAGAAPASASKFNVSTETAPEFEVSSAPEEWSPEKQ